MSVLLVTVAQGCSRAPTTPTSTATPACSFTHPTTGQRWDIYEGQLALGGNCSPPDQTCQRAVTQRCGDSAQSPCSGAPGQPNAIFIGYRNNPPATNPSQEYGASGYTSQDCSPGAVADIPAAARHHEWGHVYDITSLATAGSRRDEAEAQCFGAAITQRFGAGFADCGAAIQYLLGNVARYDPTFVQLAAGPSAARSREPVDPSGRLIAQISFPPADALVRAEVPLFGTAGGTVFSSYRVEYGEGAAPATWHVIASGNQPLTAPLLGDLYARTDLSVRGNLGTWDTGLRHYTYLPTYPRDHPVDLSGTHTVRLIVTGADGQIVEDRVTVVVANLASYAWGGEIVSRDRRIRLDVSEHAISEPFRLIAFEAAGRDVPPLPPGTRLAGPVYRVRESRETFAAPARLSVRVGGPATRSGSLGIYGYDPDDTAWKGLETRVQPLTGELRAEVGSLHSHYAVFELAGPPTSSPIRVEVGRPVAAPVDSLHVSTFEETSDVWRPLWTSGGTVVERTERHGGNHALRISPANAGRGLGVVVLDRAFDVAEFPIMEFDYRVQPGVATDFYVKASGRWYRVGFTDAPHELRNRRVNIAPAGRVSNVQADDKWHHARVDLWNALRRSTSDRLVERIIMANFDVTGTMRLQPGATADRAAYWIDNFTIRREAGHRIPATDIVVRGFAGQSARDRLDRTFTDGRGGTISADAVDRPGEPAALSLRYVVEGSGRYAGYVTTLPDTDLRAFRVLRLELESEKPAEGMLVGVRDAHGNESKVRLEDVVGIGALEGRTSVGIPLVAFAPTIDWSRVAGLVLAFESPRARRGHVIIGSVRFERALDAAAVSGFEHGIARNRLGGDQYAVATGGAIVQATEALDAGRRFLRLAFGGTIGLIGGYATEQTFSHAAWRSELRGLDCSRCGFIRLRVRGARGGEQPHLYLDDGNHRWGVDLERYGPITTGWRDVRIPLSAFAQEGVDLTHLGAIEVVFEWNEMTGVVFLDDIAFEPRAPGR